MISCMQEGEKVKEVTQEKQLHFMKWEVTKDTIGRKPADFESLLAACFSNFKRCRLKHV